MPIVSELDVTVREGRRDKNEKLYFRFEFY